MNEIKTIPSVNTSGNYWEANKDCGGFEIDHSNCDLRISEMDIISYKPQLCEDQIVQGCEQLVAYSRLNIK